MDGGRGVNTLEDGTSVYTLATNDTVTLKFVPDDGYKFVSAAQDGSELKVGSDGTCVITMDQLADWTITAKFEKKSGGSTGGLHRRFYGRFYRRFYWRKPQTFH